MDKTSLLHKYLTKMFMVAGLEFNEEFCKQEEWYYLHTWTATEQDEFKGWLVTELRKDLKCTTTLAKKEAGWFLLSYGWKLREEDK